MSITTAIVVGLVACIILIFALDRLFRPRGEKLGDVESYGDSLGSGGDGGGGD